MQTINLEEKFLTFKKHWHPHQIAVVDNMQVLLAKLKDEFVWHKHEEEDELFFVQKGTLEMHFRDKVEIISAKHTGNVTSEKTVSEYPKI
jgi:mannose-6-phosphate isomerase-like protein (cupin superfamily)